MREAPNLERTVRGIRTIDGGSHPLLVSYFALAHHTIHGGRSLSTYSTSTKYLILGPKLKMWYCPTLQYVPSVTACIHIRPKQVRSSKNSPSRFKWKLQSITTAVPLAHYIHWVC